ncbi:MAG: hypothetical protein HKN64_05165 [Woeseiaceae bacterium]|nr:hypothetical protein [Woeseiaceae bacterium]
MPVSPQVQERGALSKDEAEQLFAEIAAVTDSVGRLKEPQAVGVTGPSQTVIGEPIVTQPAQAGEAVLPGPSPGFLSNVLAGSVQDPETKKRLFAAALFPGDVAETGTVSDERLATFSVTDTGDVVYRDENGELREAKGTDIAANLGRFAAFTPEMVGGTAGAIAGGPVGAAIGAAGGAAAKKIFANTVLDEPQTAAQNAVDIGIEAALSFAGERVGEAATRTVRAATGRRGDVILGSQASAVNPKRIKAEIDRFEQATGVKLDVAQASGLASMHGLRKVIANFPGVGQDIMRANRDLQLGQSEQAVQRLMDALINAGDSVPAAARAGNLADQAIQLSRMQRAQATRPLYDQAYETAGAVDVSDIVGKLDETIASAAKGTQARLRAVRRDIVRKEGPVTDLRTLHNIRKELNDKILKATKGGDDQLAFHLRDVRRTFDEALDRDAPDVWHEAQAKWGELSETLVNPLKDGIVGDLARVKGKGAQKVQALASRWLTGQNTSPQQVRALRHTIQRQPGGRDTWRGLVRGRMAEALNKAMTETQGDGVVNIAGKFRQQLYGSPQKKAVMGAALPHDVADAFDTTMKAFDLLRRASEGGSHTAWMQQAVEGLKQGSKFAGLQNVTEHPVRSALEFVVGDSNDEAFKRGLEQIARSLVNPAKFARLQQLKALPASVETAATILGVMGALQAGQIAEVGS